MAEELSWTPQAVADLRKIDSYLSAEVDGRLAAQILETIKFRLRTLRDFPHAGPPVEGRPFRSFIIRGTPYVVAYRLRDGRVEILRVHHQRENWRLPQ